MLNHALKNLPLFAALSDAQLSEVAALVKMKKLSSGEILFQEGEDSRGIFILLSGEIKISKISDKGAEHTVCLIQPGDAFAEVVLFTDLPYPATAAASKESAIGCVPSSALERLIEKHPQLGIQVIKVLAKRLYDAQNKNKALALDNVTDRLCNFLYQKAKESGSVFTGGLCHIDLPPTRQELASMLGTTRETLTRLLMGMKKDGFIDLDKNRLSFDPDKLSGYSKNGANRKL